MVYCQSCGTKNSDTEEICINCGKALYAQGYAEMKKGDDCFGERDKAEDECFGVPGGGSVFGLLFGAIIIVAAVSWAFGFDLSIFWNNYIGPLFVGAIGLLIIIGSLIALRKSRR